MIVTGLECVLGSLFYSAAKPVVDKALELVGDAAIGVLGNRADALVCWGTRAAWKEIQKRSTEGPLNHDLQRAARRCYLLATRELLEHAGENEAAKRAAKEARDLDHWTPERPLAALDLLLLDPDTAPAKRIAEFDKALDVWLYQDLATWGVANPAVQRLQREGWRTAEGQHREWRPVMALWFVEEMKANDRVRNIFQSQMLAEIASREPALKPIAEFAEFRRRFESLSAKLDEMPARVVDEFVKRGLGPEKRLCRLDNPVRNFIPRPDLLDWLQANATPGASLLLSGEPGAGKSTLALAFGYDAYARESFPAVVGQFCGPGRSVETIGVELAAKLPGYDNQAPPDRQIAAARNWLQAHGALLILDDVWNEEVCALAPGPPATVLYTSRHPVVNELPESGIRHVAGLTPEEADVLIEKRLPGWLATDGAALRSFAQRMERLPYALAVAVDLLHKDRRPRAKAIALLRTSALKNDRLDLPALLGSAVAAVSEDARALLQAVAMCSAEGVWLPLAVEIAGLAEEAGWNAAAELAGSSLLRTLDREQSLYTVHQALRDIVGEERDPKLEWARVEALERKFEAWDKDRTKWQDPAKCLMEVEAAVEWLWAHGDLDRYWRLAYLGFDHGGNTGSLQIAYRLMQHAGRIFAIHRDRAGLLASYGNQAMILHDWGRLDEAMALHKTAEGICKERGDRAGLQVSYGNQALILKAWGRLDEAMALHKKTEAICKERGDRAGLQMSYGNQALILHDWGRLDEAMALHEKAEAICKELGDRVGLQRSYGNQALILKVWGRLDDAMALHKKAEAICVERGDRAGLQCSYCNRAGLLLAQDQLGDAMALYRKQEAICVELGDRASLQVSYGNQAVILKARGRFDEAMALLQKQEGICVDLGDHAGLARSYANQGQLLRKLDRPQNARELLTKALEIFTDLKMPRERDLVQGWLNELA